MTILFLVLAALATLAAAPAIVGMLAGAFYASDMERELGIEGQIEAARERINAAIAHNDFVNPVDQATVNRLLRESEARLDTCIRNGVVGAYRWVWDLALAIWGVVSKPLLKIDAERRWPLAFAFSAWGYALFGPALYLPAPEPGHLLLAALGVIVLLAAPRAGAPAKAKKARA